MTDELVRQQPVGGDLQTVRRQLDAIQVHVHLLTCTLVLSHCRAVGPVCVCVCVSVCLENNFNNHHTTTVLWPFFPDLPGEPVPEENFWTYGARED